MAEVRETFAESRSGDSFVCFDITFEEPPGKHFDLHFGEHFEGEFEDDLDARFEAYHYCIEY